MITPRYFDTPASIAATPISRFQPAIAGLHFIAATPRCHLLPLRLRRLSSRCTPCRHYFRCIFFFRHYYAAFEILRLPLLRH